MQIINSKTNSTLHIFCNVYCKWSHCYISPVTVYCAALSLPMLFIMTAHDIAKIIFCCFCCVRGEVFFPLLCVKDRFGKVVILNPEGPLLLVCSNRLRLFWSQILVSFWCSCIQPVRDYMALFYSISMLLCPSAVLTAIGWASDLNTQPDAAATFFKE